MRAVLLALLLSACAGARSASTPLDASPVALQQALSPLSPLLGCWRGSFDSNVEIHDERCFEPMLGGRYVRDTHIVLATPYRGETIYFWDTRSGALSFAYYASDGGSIRDLGRRLRNSTAPAASTP